MFILQIHVHVYIYIWNVLKSIVCENEHGANARIPLCKKMYLRAKRIGVAGYQSEHIDVTAPQREHQKVSKT